MWDEITYPFVTTTCYATSDDKVDVMTFFLFGMEMAPVSVNATELTTVSFADDEK